jgi:hypothetical protein
MSSRGRALTGFVCTALVLPVLMTGAALAADAPAARTAAPAAKAQPPKAAAASSTGAATLDVAQIVERHVAARGGLQAWHSVQALQYSGKLEAGKGDSYSRSMGFTRASHKPGSGPGGAAPDAKPAGDDKASGAEVLLPFTLDLKRPYQSRLEVQFAGKTSIQVYDGKQGWKVRPYLNRNDAEPFSADEIRATEAAHEELEGPLVDYAAKGTKVSLVKVEPVGGSNAYKLKLTLKNGTSRHIWIDTKTFLDVKREGVQRHMDGKMHDVYIYQRDFRKVDGGVTVPFVIETAVVGYPESHKMMIEKVAVNPKLDEATFAKPRV